MNMLVEMPGACGGAQLGVTGVSGWSRDICRIYEFVIFSLVVSVWVVSGCTDSRILFRPSTSRMQALHDFGQLAAAHQSSSREE